MKEKDKFEKMKDNLRSENEEYVSNDTSCKATLWEWVVWNERLKKLKNKT